MRTLQLQNTEGTEEIMDDEIKLYLLNVEQNFNCFCKQPEKRFK
jgi:hypothetical protein